MDHRRALRPRRAPRGRLRLPSRTFVVSAFSDIDLDLRSAAISSGRTSLISLVVMGNVDIYVPEGIAVDLSGLSVFGHRREWGRDPIQPDAPLLRVRVIRALRASQRELPG